MSTALNKRQQHTGTGTGTGTGTSRHPVPTHPSPKWFASNLNHEASVHLSVFQELRVELWNPLE